MMRAGTFKGSRPHPNSLPGGEGGRSRRGFTLIELLVVLVIIGIMSAIAIPALKGIGQSNTMTSATRQLIDDLSFARHKAMTLRTTVHVLFVPDLSPQSSTPLALDADKEVFERLKAGAFTSYAIYAERTPGDQPGQPTRRYLTKWRSIPEGTFIAPWQFGNLPNPPIPTHLLEAVRLPFPSVAGRVDLEIPHVAFDHQGRLVRGFGNGLRRGQDEFIWVTKGSILPAYDGNGNVTGLDVRESPRDNWTNFNRIHINAVTGRAKLERPEITDGGW